MSFTQIPDILIDCGKLNAYELAAALFIARKTVGWGKVTDGISLQQFMDALKLSKPTVIKAIRGLVEHRIVVKTESFRENGGQSFNRYAFTSAFIEEANRDRLPGNDTPVNDIDRGEGKGDLQGWVNDVDRACKGGLFPPVNDVYPQDKSNNKINLKQNIPPIASPQVGLALQAGQGAGLVGVATLEFPASLPEVEHATARKILCGLEDGSAQLLLDTLAAKLHVGEKVANRLGLLRWMVGQLGKGELDITAGQAWRAKQQAAKLAAAGATPQNLNMLADDIRALQRLQEITTEGSVEWLALAGQIDGKKQEWYKLRECLLRFPLPDV